MAASIRRSFCRRAANARDSESEAEADRCDQALRLSEKMRQANRDLAKAQEQLARPAYYASARRV